MRKRMICPCLMLLCLSGLICLIQSPIGKTGERRDENPTETTGLREESWPSKMTNSQGSVLLFVPAGEFVMGPNNTNHFSPASLDPKSVSLANAIPPHPVRITKPFYMARCEVTVGEYRQFVEATRYTTEAETTGSSRGFITSLVSWGDVHHLSWRQPGFLQNDYHPVVCVSWFDAVKYVEWLNGQEHMLGPSGQKMKYILPSEAQWEYACRGGSRTDYNWGDNAESGHERLNARDAGGGPEDTNWNDAFSFDDGFAATAPVGSFPENGYGLCDMHGNVSEWCADWYAPDYYRNSPVADPTGPSQGLYRVDRGGGWYSSPAGCTSFYRGKLAPDQRSANLGFRIALVVE